MNCTCSMTPNLIYESFMFPAWTCNLDACLNQQQSVSNHSQNKRRPTFYNPQHEYVSNFSLLMSNSTEVIVNSDSWLYYHLSSYVTCMNLFLSYCCLLYDLLNCGFLIFTYNCEKKVYSMTRS